MRNGFDGSPARGNDLVIDESNASNIGQRYNDSLKDPLSESRGKKRTQRIITRVIDVNKIFTLDSIASRIQSDGFYHRIFLTKSDKAVRLESRISLRTATKPQRQKLPKRGYNSEQRIICACE